MKLIHIHGDVPPPTQIYKHISKYCNTKTYMITMMNMNMEKSMYVALHSTYVDFGSCIKGQLYSTLDKVDIGFWITNDKILHCTCPNFTKNHLRFYCKHLYYVFRFLYKVDLQEWQVHSCYNLHLQRCHAAT